MLEGKGAMKAYIARAACSPYRFLIMAAVLAALFCLMPVRGDAPFGAQEDMEGPQYAAVTAQPDAAGVPAGADLSDRTQQNCALHATRYYVPCGHSVQRRETLPAQLRGLTRSALEKEIDEVIAGAKVTGFSAQEVDISQEMGIPCPLHWVLKKGENGKLQVLQNLDGEALSLVRETETALDLLPAQTHAQLLEGMVFDDVQTLEGYLESLAS